MKRLVCIIAIFIGFASHAQQIDWGEYRYPTEGWIGFRVEERKADYYGHTYEEFIKDRWPFPKIWAFDERWRLFEGIYEHFVHDFPDFDYRPMGFDPKRKEPFDRDYTHIIYAELVSMSEKGDIVMDFYFLEDEMVVGSVKGVTGRAKRMWSTPYPEVEMGAALEDVADKFFKIMKKAIKKGTI